MEKRKPRPKKEAAKKTERASFYDKLFDTAEKIDFDRACGVEGIDDEIALIRLEIVKVVSGGDAANLRLLVQATNALERLIRTRYQISREQRKGLREAIGNVLRDIAVPLGISVGTEFLSGKVR
jgi:hypothetical protein